MNHWLYTKKARRTLWIIGGIILVFIIIAEALIKLHPYFEIAEIFSFHAIFGFISCIAMIIFARLLGFFIKRRDDYYDK